ncbi:MAG TPA: efflux RND transporter periplasmic adaptor subunit [Cellvibrio sp.]|nr:efflux RND transporter periplasmic adaptor subunit [Cellvibrio sp.]
MNTLTIFLNAVLQKKRIAISCGLSLALATITLASLAKDNHDEHKKPEPATHNKTAKEDAHKEHDESEEHEEKAAQLNDAQLTAASIKTAQAGPASIRETISLYGTVEANGERIQHISARFPGLIKTVNKKLGDSVRQDEVLATIEGNESLRTYAVTAAFNGIVAERDANPGEHTSDKPLFVVADLSSVWVNIAVFPRDIGKVRSGQSVRITNPNNELRADGKIIAVSSLGSANQTLNARVLLDNPEHQWIPGMFVNADVTLATTAVTLAISNEAVQEHEGKTVVFVKGKQGFEPRPIKLGRTDGEISEVLAGIKVGETYATHNSFIIKAELGKDGAAHGH